MDYPCAKFGDFIFNGFDFIVRTDRQTDRQTESYTLTDAAHRYTLVIAVCACVSNNIDLYTFLLYSCGWRLQRQWSNKLAVK